MHLLQPKLNHHNRSFFQGHSIFFHSSNNTCKDSLFISRSFSISSYLSENELTPVAKSCCRAKSFSDISNFYFFCITKAIFFNNLISLCPLENFLQVQIKEMIQMNHSKSPFFQYLAVDWKKPLSTWSPPRVCSISDSIQYKQAPHLKDIIKIPWTYTEE